MKALARAVAAMTADDRHDFGIHLGTEMHLGKDQPSEIAQMLCTETIGWEGDYPLDGVLLAALDDAFPTISGPAQDAIVERLFRFAMRAHPLGEGVDETRAETIRTFDRLFNLVSRYQEDETVDPDLRAFAEAIDQGGAEILTQDDLDQIVHDALDALSDPAYGTNAEALDAIEAGYLTGIGATLPQGPKNRSAAWNAEAIRLAVESALIRDQVEPNRP